MAVTFLADWSADPSRGGWGDRQTTAADRLVVDASLVAPGGKPAVRCTVRPGDDPIGAGGERSEVLWPVRPDGSTIFEAEGAAAVYYAWAVRFPAGWAGSLDPSGDWSIVFQMHGPDQLKKPAPFMFQAGAPGPGQAPVYRLKILAGDCANKTGADIETPVWAGTGNDAVRAGIWTKFVAKFVFSKTAGETRVWRRDEDAASWTEVIARTNKPTLQYSSTDTAAAYGKPMLPAGSIGEHYFKQGLYRGATPISRTDTYHFSGATARADTFAEAEAAAFGAPAGGSATATGTAAAMALTLTDFQPGFVAQRTAGTTGRANLGVSWQASSPGNVQARVVTASGAVVVDWQTCTSQTASGGVLPGPVPQGDGYRVQIREGSNGAVQAGANAWGVGVIFAFHGQSNMRGILYGGWTGQEMDLYNDSPKLARSFYYSGWSVFGHNLDFNNDSLYLFGREMVAALGGNVPVGVVPVAENSRSIEAFLPGPNGDVYYNFFAATASGKGDGNAGYGSPRHVWSGDLEGVFYHQGEADVGQTDAWYKERLGTLHRQFLTQVAPFGRTAATFLFCPGLIASETAYDGRNVGGLRRAVLSYVAERRASGDAVDVFSTADFATSLEDDLHFGEGDSRMAMRRIVQHAKRKVGAASYGGRGAAVASMSRSGRTVTVAIAHDGGATLRTARGGAPSGFAASTDGFASHKVPLTATVSGNTVTLALPAEFDGRAATIGHLQAVPRSATALLPTPAAYPVAGAVIDGDTRPDVSNNLYDDAAIPGGVRGQADPTAPGLPLLPTFGAWTLSDGQTISAPAGATSAGGGSTAPATPATPGKVTGLRVTSVSGTTIAYTWDNYVGASVYRAEMRARGGAVASTDTWGGIDTIASPTTTGSKGGLVDGTHYELRVLARDSAGNTLATSDTVSVTIGTPAAAATPGGTAGGGTSTGTTTGPWADAGTLRLVGSGRTYSTIQAAVDAAVAGDTVIVDDGVYAPFRLSKRVLVRARNRLGATIDAKLSGSYALVDGKGAVLVTADGARLAGFWVINGTSGAVGSESNPVAGGEAGVRVDANVGTFYMDGCRLDNNANGLFSGGTNTVYETNCEYGVGRSNGATKDFKTHDVYVTGGTVLFDTRNSFHYGNPTGHDIKSRSATTRVVGGYTVGKGIRNFDISDGGLVEISGAYITHDPSNGQRDFLAIGPESTSNGANPNCKLTGGTIVCRQSNMRVSLQAGVGLACSGVTQVWVNDGNGSPSLDLNAQGGTISGLAASPGGATVLGAMPAAPVFAYDASLAPGIAYSGGTTGSTQPAASTGAGTGTSTGGTTAAPGAGSTGTGTSTTPATGTNTTGAQVAYYTLEGKAVLDAASAKLLTSVLSGAGSTGGTPAPSTGAGTTAGGTGSTGTGATGGGATTPAPTTTPKVTGLRVTSIQGTTIYYAWDAYPGAASYRAEARARDGANATETWSGIGTLDGSTTSESKGGLPDNTTYQFRVIARDSSGATLAVSDPLTVVLGTPATASTGTGGSAGTGASTGGGTTTPSGSTALYTGTIEALRLTAAVPTLPVQLRVKAEEAITNPPVCCGHPFGPGHVPSGSRVRLRTAAGAEIAVQQDDETTWPDGSLKYAVLSFVAPDTFAAGQTIPYTVDAVTGAPNRAASHTLAQLAAGSDFRLEVKGFSFGSAVGVMRVNDLVSANRVTPWGTNPKSGIEVVASGPIRQEWRFWAVAKRQSDGALHESVRLELYVRRWAATGAFEVLGRQRQPNLDAAYYGSTWSTRGWNQGNAGIAECFNGTARVFAMGGPNDRDARTVPPSQFNAGEGKYNFRADQNLGQVSAIDGAGTCWYGMGVPVGFSGDVPGGLSGSTPYYLGGDGRVLAARNDGGSGVGFSAPGGNCTVFPLVASFPGTGVVFADEQGDPYWVGAGARPRVRVGHDDAYLTRASRLFLPMDLTQPRPAEPATGGSQWPYHPYRPNQLLGEQWIDWGKEGDDWEKDRVGWLSRQHANLLLTPFDRVRRTHCVALAYMQGDGHFDWEDQRSGRIYACNNTQYPELAAPLPTLYMTLRDDSGINSSSPGFAAMAYYNKGGSGYTARYDNLGEASHWPSWQIVPYLLNGHRVHLDLQRTGTGVMAAVKDAGLRNRNLKPPQVPAARTFYCIFHDQPRSLGWQRIALSNLRHTLPDGHPERAYFDAFAEENATYYGAIAPFSPWKLFGQVPIGPSGPGDMSDYTDGHAQYQTDANTGFHMVYQTLGALVARYRGEAAWDQAIDVYLGYLRDCADDQQYPDGTGFFTGHYGTTFRRGDGALFPTRREWIENRAAAEMGAKG